MEPISYDDKGIPSPVLVVPIRSAPPADEGSRATRSAVVAVGEAVEVQVSSPPAGAADSFVAERPEFFMETLDQMDVPPIEEEDLKVA